MATYLALQPHQRPRKHEQSRKHVQGYSAAKTLPRIVIGDEDGSLGITGDDPTLDDATWVKSPQRFLESHSGHQDWKSYVRRVYVQCGESIRPGCSIIL